MSKESKQLTDQYYGLACPDNSCNLANSQTSKKMSFWGKLAAAIGGFIGGLVAGPVGASIGYAFGVWASDHWNFKTTTVIEGSPIQDQYPLAEKEELKLLNWFQNNFIKAVTKLADLIDMEITSQSNKRTTTVSNNVVNVSNRILKFISIMRSNNATIDQYGEKSGGSFIGQDGQTIYVKHSNNYVKNKIQYSELFLDALEKGVFDYMEKHALDHKLVIEQETVSNINQIEGINLDWQGKTVTANIKKYVSETIPTKPNQVEVVVTNTDPLDPKPSTNEEVVTTTTPVITDSQRGNSKYMKWLTWAGIGFVAYKVINHKKSK